MVFSPLPLLNFSASLSSYSALTALTVVLSITSAYPATLTVAAAADLIQVQPSLSASFQKQTGANVVFSSGASGLLARQIENGAPFDVFLSANEKYVKDLASSGQIFPASVIVYAQGRLGLWSRDPRLRALDRLTSPAVRVVAIANPSFAPYGAAARELLENLGLWKQIQPKIVFGENVTQTLQFAETGNADVALTSWTLVSAKGGILLPARHAPISQAAGIVASTRQLALARQFLAFLQSPAGRAILAAHGLLPPTPPGR